MYVCMFWVEGYLDERGDAHAGSQKHQPLEERGHQGLLLRQVHVPGLLSGLEFSVKPLEQGTSVKPVKRVLSKRVIKQHYSSVRQLQRGA